MSLSVASRDSLESLQIPLVPAEDAPLDRESAMQEIFRLMDQWKVAPQELIDPAERQPALGNARRLVDFWRITPEELEGPPPARPLRKRAVIPS